MPVGRKLKDIPFTQRERRQRFARDRSRNLGVIKSIGRNFQQAFNSIGPTPSPFGGNSNAPGTTPNAPPISSPGGGGADFSLFSNGPPVGELALASYDRINDANILRAQRGMQPLFSGGGNKPATQIGGGVGSGGSGVIAKVRSSDIGPGSAANVGSRVGNSVNRAGRGNSGGTSSFGRQRIF